MVSLYGASNKYRRYFRPNSLTESVQRVKEEGDEKGGLGPCSSSPKDPHKGLHYSAQGKLAPILRRQKSVSQKKLQSTHKKAGEESRNAIHTMKSKPCSPQDTICTVQFARCAIHSRSRINPHKELKGNQATQSTRFNKKCSPEDPTARLRRFLMRARCNFIAKLRGENTKSTWPVIHVIWYCIPIRDLLETASKVVTSSNWEEYQSNTEIVEQTIEDGRKNLSSVSEQVLLAQPPWRSEVSLAGG